MPLSLPPELTISNPPLLIVAPNRCRQRAQAPAAADGRAARGAAGLHHLQAREDRGAAGQTVIKLRAARDLRAKVAAVGADNLAAAAEDDGRVRGPAGKHLQRAAARYRHIARTTTRRHNLSAAAADRRTDGATAGEHDQPPAAIDRQARSGAAGPNLKHRSDADRCAVRRATGRDLLIAPAI